jgi:hypothetical protein
MHVGVHRLRNRDWTGYNKSSAYRLKQQQRGLPAGAAAPTDSDAITMPQPACGLGWLVYPPVKDQ